MPCFCLLSAGVSVAYSQILYHCVLSVQGTLPPLLLLSLPDGNCCTELLPIVRAVLLILCHDLLTRQYLFIASAVSPILGRASVRSITIPSVLSAVLSKSCLALLMHMGSMGQVLQMARSLRPVLTLQRLAISLADRMQEKATQASACTMQWLRQEHSLRSKDALGKQWRIVVRIQSKRFLLALCISPTGLIVRGAQWGIGSSPRGQVAKQLYSMSPPPASTSCRSWIPLLCFTIQDPESLIFDARFKHHIPILPSTLVPIQLHRKGVA